MPRFDGKGPSGMGPGTGRGRGVCSSDSPFEGSLGGRKSGPGSPISGRGFVSRRDRLFRKGGGPGRGRNRGGGFGSGRGTAG